MGTSTRQGIKLGKNGKGAEIGNGDIIQDSENEIFSLGDNVIGNIETLSDFINAIENYIKDEENRKKIQGNTLALPRKIIDQQMIEKQLKSQKSDYGSLITKLSRGDGTGGGGAGGGLINQLGILSETKTFEDLQKSKLKFDQDDLRILGASIANSSDVTSIARDMIENDPLIPSVDVSAFALMMCIFSKPITETYDMAKIKLGSDDFRKIAERSMTFLKNSIVVTKEDFDVSELEEFLN